MVKSLTKDYVKYADEHCDGATTIIVTDEDGVARHHVTVANSGEGDEGEVAGGGEVPSLPVTEEHSAQHDIHFQ